LHKSGILASRGNLYPLPSQGGRATQKMHSIAAENEEEQANCSYLPPSECPHAGAFTLHKLEVCGTRKLRLVLHRWRSKRENRRANQERHTGGAVTLQLSALLCVGDQ